MPISQGLLAEFDHEMSNTRKTLERFPDDKPDWKPHAKSFSMAALASHVAHLPNWGVMTLTEDQFDFAPVGAPPYQEETLANRQALLAEFDKGATATREALAKTSDDQFMKEWALMAGGQTIFKMPRVAVMRSFVMNHMIHHRAQLGVYLRLNDIPVPAIYGPSADESNM